MTARIIDRGRGPEIDGTRVTVYRVLDYVREGSPPARTAAELDLTGEQLEAALRHIADHPEVEREYEAILARVRQTNSREIEAGRARSVEELKERIASRLGNAK